MSTDVDDPSERELGYRMLWGALGPSDQAALIELVQAHRAGVPRRLALSITTARQSLEIDGRLVPRVLGDAMADDADGDVPMEPDFSHWVAAHDLP